MTDKCPYCKVPYDAHDDLECSDVQEWARLKILKVKKQKPQVEN